ncbi:MAG TPA: ectoine utilization protein EutA [Dongiaceae bacterium]
MKTFPDLRRSKRQPILDTRPKKKRVGLIILATDHTTEPDFHRMVASDDIGIYVSRIPYANPTTPTNLRAMQPTLTRGASYLLPEEELDAICYSCTSASVVIGDEAVQAAINEAKPGIPVVTPADASVLALTALRARKISILTPYAEETTLPVAEYFAKRGFNITAVTCLGFTDDREMARISPASLIDLASEAITDDADALFISCTAVRAASAAPEIERVTGRPLVSSNLATAWRCLRLCNDRQMRPQLGRLMALPAASA